MRTKSASDCELGDRELGTSWPRWGLFDFCHGDAHIGVDLNSSFASVLSSC